MVIISKTKLTKFGQDHSDSILPLNDWWLKTKKAEWTTMHDMKETFNSVDYVGNGRYVFNIKGNNYRLVALIFFDIRTLYIRFIGTHTEYDKIDSRTI